MGLQDLPSDVLFDNVLPHLSAQQTLRLAQTNKFFHTLINGPSAQALWARMLKAHFNFPIHNSARSYGWKEIYKRLSNPAVFVWGARDKGRLTIRPSDPRERYVEDGGVRAPMRLWFKTRIVDMVSGGWSFHALDSDGRVYYWGTMNADHYAGYNGTIANPGMTVAKPTLIQPHLLPNRITSLDCGRSHALALDDLGNVWQWSSWGRILNIRDKEHEWGWKEGKSAVKLISAGWHLSTVLTNAGDAYIWWDLEKSKIEDKASEQQSARRADGGESADVDAVSFRYEIATIRLPALPAVDGEVNEEKITQLAAGDKFVIALSSSARVYKLDVSPPPLPNAANQEEEEEQDTDEISGLSIKERERLSRALISGKRTWKYLPFFSSITHIHQLPAFSPIPSDSEDATGKLEPLPRPSDSTRINHISAHYKHFVAYSGTKEGIDLTGEQVEFDHDSIVLLGKGEFDGKDEEQKPEVIRELQGLGVIKVTMGDYHFGALTSSGKLYVWGTNNSGCLGLGKPHSPLDSQSAGGPQPPTPHPDFTGNLIPLPGFRVPGRRGPVLPHLHANTPRQQPHLSFNPTNVDIPRTVHFPPPSHTALQEGDHLLTDPEDGIVFSVAFAGHHSSALVIYPHDGSDEKQRLPEGERWCDEDWGEDENLFRPGGHAAPLLLRRGGLPVRLGFPARGMVRGHGEGRGGPI
ncbi:RCC1/BLIP-II [Atractiella rhizophila]|nr:RCC1/BLIP-II [Atractiella rhizophila]